MRAFHLDQLSLASLGISIWAACTLGCSTRTPQTLPTLDAANDAGENQDEAAIDLNLLNLSDSADKEASGLFAGGADDAGVDTLGVDFPRAEAGTTCQTAFAGCASFTDATATDADRTIHFQDYSYTPQCLMIRSGQTVTFSGDFIRHPLTPSCGPELLLAYRDTAPTASFVLQAAGIYGYYCLDHGNPQGDVMSGAIEVVP